MCCMWCMHGMYAIADHVEKVRSSWFVPISWIRCAAVFVLSVQQLFIPVDFIITFHLLYYVCAVSLTAWSSTRFRSGYSSLFGGAHNRNKTFAVVVSCQTPSFCRTWVHWQWEFLRKETGAASNPFKGQPDCQPRTASNPFKGQPDCQPRTINDVSTVVAHVCRHVVMTHIRLDPNNLNITQIKPPVGR